MSKSFEEVFYGILSDYFETFEITEPIIPDYRIVEDMASEYLMIRPDVLQRSNVGIDELNQYNGFAIPPQELGGTFTVLINKSILAENISKQRMDWVGTIVHETTHVQDYAEYAQRVGADSYDEILEIDDHGMFNLWSEIHARANGYYFVRKYALGIEYMKSEEMLEDIVEREIPAQWSLLYDNYHSTQDGYKQAYLVAQYMGRLYTLQKLYPDTLSDEWIEIHFGGNKWMNEWFRFYKNYPVLHEACLHFEEMKSILGQNFYGM